MVIEKIQVSLFLIKDAGLSQVINVIRDHACLKNDYEIKKIKSTILKLFPQIFK